MDLLDIGLYWNAYLSALDIPTQEQVEVLFYLVHQLIKQYLC